MLEKSSTFYIFLRNVKSKPGSGYNWYFCTIILLFLKHLWPWKNSFSIIETSFESLNEQTLFGFEKCLIILIYCWVIDHLIWFRVFGSIWLSDFNLWFSFCATFSYFDIRISGCIKIILRIFLFAQWLKTFNIAINS
jgi:hypothetical protein